MYQAIPAVPAGAAENGNEANGEALFVARARFNGGLQPGKCAVTSEGLASLSVGKK